jgi:hypothetical protein
MDRPDGAIIADLAALPHDLGRDVAAEHCNRPRPQQPLEAGEIRHRPIRLDGYE